VRDLLAEGKKGKKGLIRRAYPLSIRKSAQAEWTEGKEKKKEGAPVQSFPVAGQGKKTKKKRAIAQVPRRKKKKKKKRRSHGARHIFPQGGE